MAAKAPARHAARAWGELVFGWTYLKVRGRWCHLYRAVDRYGNLIDAVLSEHRDMKAAKTFFRWPGRQWACALTG